MFMIEKAIKRMILFLIFTTLALQNQEYVDDIYRPMVHSIKMTLEYIEVKRFIATFFLSFLLDRLVYFLFEYSQTHLDHQKGRGNKNARIVQLNIQCCQEKIF